jgi:ferrous iron transport protein B
MCPTPAGKSQSRETGGWKWPILQFAHMGVLAYVGAFIAFHAIG